MDMGRHHVGCFNIWVILLLHAQTFWIRGRIILDICDYINGTNFVSSINGRSRLFAHPQASAVARQLACHENQPGMFCMYWRFGDDTSDYDGGLGGLVVVCGA